MFVLKNSASEQQRATLVEHYTRLHLMDTREEADEDAELNFRINSIPIPERPEDIEEQKR